MNKDLTFHNLCACLREEDSIFKFVGEENLGAISEFFQCVTVSAGEVLWREGDDCDYVAFIVSGQVEVKKQTEFEGKHVIVGLYNRGAVVGAVCILDGSKRAVTAKAVDDTSLAVISRDNFEKLIEEHPVLGTKLMKGMLLSFSVRLRKSFERLATFF